MSEVLDRLARRFSQRLRTHRVMLARLGIVVGADRAEELRPVLRETLLSCTSCAEPEACAAWASSGFPGLPAWCRARDAFERLALAAREPQEALDDEMTSAPVYRVAVMAGRRHGRFQS